jgi:hypothetical protein
MGRRWARRRGFCRHSYAGAIHEEKDGRRCHFANSGWLSGCWDCLGRKLPRGASKRVDADRPTPPVAAIAVDASALNGTISEKQMTDVVRVTRTRELLGRDQTVKRYLAVTRSASQSTGNALLRLEGVESHLRNLVGMLAVVFVE